MSNQIYSTHYYDMFKPVLALEPLMFTSGDDEDGVEQEGESIDRLDFAAGQVVIPVVATLQENETATLEVVVEESADESEWVTFEELDDTVLTGDTGGSTESDALRFNVNLQGAKRYVRVNITCTLSDTETTDTVNLSAVMMVTGSSENPV